MKRLQIMMLCIHVGLAVASVGGLLAHTGNADIHCIAIAANLLAAGHRASCLLQDTEF